MRLQLAPLGLMLGRWRFKQAIPDLLLNERSKDALENEFVVRGTIQEVLVKLATQQVGANLPLLCVVRGIFLTDFLWLQRWKTSDGSDYVEELKRQVAEKVTETPALGQQGMNYRLGQDDAKQVRAILSAMDGRQRADPCGWALLQRSAWESVNNLKKVQEMEELAQFKKLGWVYTVQPDTLQLVDQPEFLKATSKRTGKPVQEHFLEETRAMVDVYDVVDTDVFKSVNKPALINLIMDQYNAEGTIQQSDLEAMAEIFVLRFVKDDVKGCCGGDGTDKEVVRRIRASWESYYRCSAEDADAKSTYMRELKADLQEIGLFHHECVQLSDSMFVFDRESKIILHTGFSVWRASWFFLPFISLIPALLMANSAVDGQLASLGTFIFIMSLWSLGWGYLWITWDSIEPLQSKQFLSELPPPFRAMMLTLIKEMFNLTGFAFMPSLPWQQMEEPPDAPNPQKLMLLGFFNIGDVDTHFWIFIGAVIAIATTPILLYLTRDRGRGPEAAKQRERRNLVVNSKITSNQDALRSHFIF